MSDSYQAYRVKADSNFDDGRYSEAAFYYRKILDAAPENLYARTMYYRSRCSQILLSDGGARRMSEVAGLKCKCAEEIIDTLIEHADDYDDPDEAVSACITDILDDTKNFYKLIKNHLEGIARDHNIPINEMKMAETASQDLETPNIIYKAVYTKVRDAYGSDSYFVEQCGDAQLSYLADNKRYFKTIDPEVLSGKIRSKAPVINVSATTDDSSELLNSAAHTAGKVLNRFLNKLKK